jgi:hypothetical protein
MSSIDPDSLDRALGLLGELVRVRHHPPIHLVVCGGSALIALRLVTWTTQDVDVLATLENGRLHCARPLPEWLLAAAEAVRSELSLPIHWLNDGPADENLFRLGLPVGLAERLVVRDFGAALQVSFISRYDQIHFKLYAAADQGGRHFTDFAETESFAGGIAGGRPVDLHAGCFRRLSSGRRRSPPSPRPRRSA